MKTTATSVLASVKLLLEGKYIVWVKDRSDSEWEPNGDGPMTQKDADRVVRELRGTCRARALPVGMDLPLQAQHRREESGPREQLIAMYNERCGMDHDGIIAAIERTR